MRVRYTHTSSRFSRSGYSLWFFIVSLITRRSIIFMTEVSNNERVARLKKIKGWTFWQISERSGHDECAIMTKNSVWQASHHPEIWRLSSAPVPGRNSPVYALVLRINAVNEGLKLLAAVMHNAAHLDKTVNREINREVEERFARHLQLAHENDGREIIATADHNRDWREPEVRYWFRNLYPVNFHFTWGRYGKKLPKLGTYEDRVIDWGVHTGRAVRRRVHRLNPSSDHRAFSETVEF